jgi:hemerythrin-like domain-containing protein
MSVATAKRTDQTGARTPDRIFVDLIHQALRIDGTRLVDSVAALDSNHTQSRLPAIRVFFDRYCDQLRIHHSHEDKLFFPAVEARVGADRMRLGDLTQQHEVLDATLQAVSGRLATLADPCGDFTTGRTAAWDALAAMRRFLATHLDLEEATVLPLLESEIPAAEYKRLETQARRATPRAEAQFLIPWLVAHATPSQRKTLFRSAPPLRLINLVGRRRYRRLDNALVHCA